MQAEVRLILDMAAAGVPADQILDSYRFAHEEAHPRALAEALKQVEAILDREIQDQSSATSRVEP